MAHAKAAGADQKRVARSQKAGQFSEKGAKVARTFFGRAADRTSAADPERAAQTDLQKRMQSGDR